MQAAAANRQIKTLKTQHLLCLFRATDGSQQTQSPHKTRAVFGIVYLAYYSYYISMKISLKFSMSCMVVCSVGSSLCLNPQPSVYNGPPPEIPPLQPLQTQNDPHTTHTFAPPTVASSS